MAASTPDEVFANFGLSRDKFVDFVTSVNADARSILQDKLLYSKPSVDLSKLTDDLNEQRVSFVVRESNNLQPSTRITDIASNYGRKSEALETLPNKSTYRENIEEFLEMMLLLFLFTGGQPDQGVSAPTAFSLPLSARRITLQILVWQPSTMHSDQTTNNYGLEQPEIFARDTTQEVPPELISLTHSTQSPSEGPFTSRAFYIEDGQVCIITADHHNAPGFRGRFLPDEVSQMLVLYLACVLPFQRTLDPSDCYSTSECLFAHKDGTWHTMRYYHVLMMETKARMGVEMDLATANDFIRKMNVVLSKLH